MKRILLLAAERPWLVMGLLLVLTLAAGLQLGGLQFRLSAQSMLVEADPAVELYHRVLQNFGAEEITVLYLQDNDLFEPESLAAIRNAVERIDALPFVRRSESLFSINRMQSDGDEIALSPYLAEIPPTREAAERIVADALQNPFIADNVLARSGTAMAINIYLEDAGDNPDFDRRVTVALEEIVAPLVPQLQFAFQLGSPQIRSAISAEILKDQATLLPLALVVLIVTLGFTLRRLSAMLIPLLTAGISIVWTLGLMAALGIPVNVMTAIVPALLVIIGSTEDVHLLAEYLTGIAAGRTRQDAITAMARRMGLAVALTFVTTYLGFLSIALNDIQLLREFGLVASTGLLFNFLATILLVPAMLKLFADARPGNGPRKALLVQRLATAVFDRLARHRVAVAVVSGVLLVGALWGASQLRVNNNSLAYLGTDSAILVQIDRLQEELAGLQTLSIVFSSGIEDTFLKVRYLEQLEALQHYLADSGIADTTLAITDFVKLVYRVVEGPDAEDDELYLPDDDAVAGELIRMLDHKHVAGYISRDYGQARMLVRHDMASSQELSEAIERIEAYARQQFDPGIRIDVTGRAALSARAADYLASAQAKSLALMVVAIFVTVGILFVNAKAGLFAVIPNLFPIVLLFGIMGIAGIPLDTGTAMTAAIAIGISIDDTMHFMVRYHQTSQGGGDSRTVLRSTVQHEALPILSTSIALALGFAVIGLSSFPPVAYFGLLSALVMLLAVIATFVLTPMLLSLTRLITVWDLLSVHLRRQVIERCPLFRGLRSWQIKKAILLSQVNAYRAGEFVFHEGEESQELFVILEGTAIAQVTLPDGEIMHLRTMGDGEVFGEIALVSKVPRTADIVAASPLQVLVLDWESISRVSRVYPRIAARLFLNLSSVLGTRLADATPSSRADQQ